MTKNDRHRMFMVAGNRYADAAMHTRINARMTGRFNYRVYDYFGAAVAAFRAAQRVFDTPSPAPAPVVPTGYPDPVSYLNRCEHFRRSMNIMERRIGSVDYDRIIPVAAALSPHYHNAEAAYTASVSRAMSLDLPFPPYIADAIFFDARPF